MYRTITDEAFSRSPECPFIIDEPSMAKFRDRLSIYEKEKTLLSPDAQVGVRKSIAVALGERKDFTPVGTIQAIVYPYSVDVGRIVDGLCGPIRPFEDFSSGELDRGSGTMSMDLETEDDTPSTPSELSLSSKAVGSKAHEDGSADWIGGSSDRKL